MKVCVSQITICRYITVADTKASIKQVLQTKLFQIQKLSEWKMCMGASTQYCQFVSLEVFSVVHQPHFRCSTCIVLVGSEVAHLLKILIQAFLFSFFFFSSKQTRSRGTSIPLLSAQIALSILHCEGIGVIAGRLLHKYNAA